jgi:hypothetical protein
MDVSAPALLQAVEASGIAAAIRQSVWIYPSANIVHVLALAGFSGAVAVLDLTVLGIVRATDRISTVRGARRAAMASLALLFLTGAVLFTAEASHVSLNPVMQTKAVLIALGLLNALAVASPLTRALYVTPPDQPLPVRVRSAAVASLAIWFAVAGCGRLIAYV